MKPADEPPGRISTRIFPPAALHTVTCSVLSEAAPARRSRFGAVLTATLALLFVGLLAANLWFLVRINDRLAAPPPSAGEPGGVAAVGEDEQ